MFSVFQFYFFCKKERERENTSILITVLTLSILTLCRGERIEEKRERRGRGKKEQPKEGGTAEAEGGRRSKRSKVASKQTNRNAKGSPTVINDHLVVILSPIKGVTPREASSRYFDAVEDHESVVHARDSTVTNGRT